MENCAVPKLVKPVAESIEKAVSSVGIRGPVQIRGFGNLDRMDEDIISGLSSSGIQLHHIPPDGKGKGSADSALQLDLVSWVFNNPPPAHLFLISGDRDFATLLHRMRRCKYNIILASIGLSRVHVILSSAASIIFDWEKLLRREHLTGRFFKQPPTDLWYDHYEGPLENAFTGFESYECSWDTKLKPHDLSKSFIWTAVQGFLNSHLGFVLIAQSRSRGQMGYFLRKYGPSCLKYLNDNDALQMVDILIEQKGWMQESQQLICKFKITLSARITSSAGGNSNGLRS